MNERWEEETDQAEERVGSSIRKRRYTSAVSLSFDSNWQINSEIRGSRKRA